MDSQLQPTLWRTCRVLANRERLEVLRVLVTQGEQRVSNLARTCGMPVARATQQLRAPQARGLLRARRQSRWVFYRPEADPLVPQSAPLLAAVQRAFARGDDAKVLMQAFTALTHERRIRIVGALRAEPLAIESLRTRTAISTPALWRHLRKLRRRGVVGQDEDGRFRLKPLAPGLLRDLMAMARTGS